MKRFIVRIATVVVLLAVTVFYLLPVFAEEKIAEDQFNVLIGKWRRVRFNEYTPNDSVNITGVANKALQGSFFSTYPSTITLSPENSRVELVKGKIKVEIKIPTADFTLYLSGKQLSGEVFVRVGANLGKTFPTTFERDKGE